MYTSKDPYYQRASLSKSSFRFHSGILILYLYLIPVWESEVRYGGGTSETIYFECRKCS